jgi:Tfp pilus assembly protein PilN
MRAVNLLPAPRVEKRQDHGESRARTTKVIAIAAGLMLALVTVAVGFAFVQEHSAVNDRRSTLDGLQAKLAQTHVAKAPSAAGAAKTQDHLAAITSAASGRIVWDGLLDQLSRVMPSGASLETLKAGDGADASSASAPSTSTSTSSSSSTPSKSSSTSGAASATGAAPTAFVVTGYARSQATVARALDRIALIPALSDVSLQSTQRADVAGKKAVQFTIGANLRPAGGTPR